MTNDQTTQEETETAESGPRWAPGVRRTGRVTQASGFETKPPEPARVINTQHVPPREPTPPYWRGQQAVKEKAEEFRAAAKQEEAKAKEIERHFDSLERRLSAIDHIVAIKTKEVNKFRECLTGLDPVKLRARWELAYWKHTNFQGPIETNEWLLAASLKANAKDLRAMLQDRISSCEAEIATMEAEKADIERELEGEETETEAKNKPAAYERLNGHHRDELTRNLKQAWEIKI